MIPPQAKTSKTEGAWINKVLLEVHLLEYPCINLKKWQVKLSEATNWIGSANQSCPIKLKEVRRLEMTNQSYFTF